MNKKILMVAMSLILLAIPILTILPVYAGKGQEKLDFELYLRGMIVGVERVRESDGITHYYGMMWDTFDNTAANLYVKVDGDMYAPVDYTFYADLAVIKTGRTAIHAIDTVFFEDGSTLVLKVQDHAPIPYSGTFTGYGTGSLEGVKVYGVTNGDGTEFIRSGTVMGWPW